MINKSELKRALAEAGLLVVDSCGDLSGLIPPIVAGQAASCPTEDGRSEAQVDIDDPRLHEKANEDWYRLALEAGLFSESDRRFLVGVGSGEDEPGQWVCVELQSSWDIMGKGASGLLGSAYCRPEFIMLSRDGSVISCGTTWQFTVGTFVLRDPHRSQILRDFAQYVAETDVGHPDEAGAAARWLESHHVGSGGTAGLSPGEG